ncbi:SH3 domain-containing protein 19 isoform X2 [Cephus cinctus]|uniref:SH3 domain-containing protein 19 isoform X2 n=1 Tax=Cephus cinctus TaxID=211228 RepID=A0AAJ7RT85_CEPCN|nr:SH3 domain-containing protein 19 isoform X2 [Cephus cinctus]
MSSLEKSAIGKGRNSSICKLRLFSNYMRIPTRAAPRSPSNSVVQRNAVWRTNNDLFGVSLMQQPVQKKKPPPRPPPPKFPPTYTENQNGQKPKKPARPTEVLTSLFGRKATKSQRTNVEYSYSRSQASILQPSNVSNGTVSLIDLSPPGSPTFTTRSNSDGVSVDSFGSDGNSNPSVITSSGNTSQTESAFEDDFDFFCGITNQKVAQNDPWKINTVQDPFSSHQISNSSSTNSNTVKHVGEASFFTFNNDNCTMNEVPFNQPSSNMTQLTPTIIRAKPVKPPAPRSIQKNSSSNVDEFAIKPIPLPRSVVPCEPVTLDFNSAWNDDLTDEPSPPMPSIPPPAPPTEFLKDLEQGTIGNNESPHGIALYDFNATQPDDLALKEGDIVILIKAINDDWIEGRVGNQQGIFPANFIDVKVPLPGLSRNVVNALYTFKGETWEDLSFVEGSRITILSRISDDWLYGECNGKRGQFPANYVHRVSINLPNYS